MKRLVLLLFLGACTERMTAPGVCPDFCPGSAIAIKDTILTDVIQRDTAFRGYVQPYAADFMAVADSPGVISSRAIFLMESTAPTAVTPKADTVPITVDSVRLRVVIARRDTGSKNLYLKLYRLPITIDSMSTFAQLDPAFTVPALDSMNVSDLLTRAAIGDTATVRIWGDSIRVDPAGHVLQIVRGDSTLKLFFHLDTIQAPFVPADSGRLAFGVRVAADLPTSISLGANVALDHSPQIRRFYHYTIPDTVTATPDSVVYTNGVKGARFHSFVFNPPNPPLDDNLTVGGAPSSRSLLRVAWPAFLHDSIDIVRATVVLVPVAPVPGVPADSFSLLARPVLTDLGAKSPLSAVTQLFGRTTIRIGAADTVRIELVDLARTWALDTTITTAVMLSAAPEAALYAEIRFYSSRAPAFRPALQVTYVKRFPFGTP